MVGWGRRGFSSWIWGWNASATVVVVVRRRFFGVGCSRVVVVGGGGSDDDDDDGVRSDGGRKEEGISSMASGYGLSSHMEHCTPARIRFFKISDDTPDIFTYRTLADVIFD